MREVQIGDTALMECEKCHGMWVDSATFEQLCADRDTQVAVLQQYSARPPKSASAEEVKYRPCVACGTMMNRLNFGRLSGTIIDVCKGHGTFLDAGELHQIVTFIQNGGLDRARQRQIDDMKEEEEQLRLMQSRNDGMADYGFGSTTTSTGVDLLALLKHLGERKY